jgi:predicted phage tail protein
MLREIKLYGQLAKFVGHRKLQAAVSNAAEAIRFLLANFPGLDQHMAERHYKVLTGDYALTMAELHDPAGVQAIKIVPVVGGAGGGTGTILAGVGLIAFAILTAGAGAGFLGLGQSVLGAVGPFAGGLTQGFILGSAASSALGFIGASLVIGGVAQMLSPTAAATSLNTAGGTGSGGSSDPRESYSFNGVQNVSRQGVPVPIIFGEVVCGSITVSAGIDVAQKKV